MDYSVYKKYFEAEQAEALADLLKKHNIDCEVSRDRDSLDSLYGDNHFKTVYFVKLKPSFFEVADNLLLAESENEANQDTYIRLPMMNWLRFWPNRTNGMYWTINGHEKYSSRVEKSLTREQLNL